MNGLDRKPCPHGTSMMPSVRSKQHESWGLCLLFMDEASKEGVPEILLVLITLHACVCLAIATVGQTFISNCLGVKWRPNHTELLSHEVFHYLWIVLKCLPDLPFQLRPQNSWTDSHPRKLTLSSDKPQVEGTRPGMSGTAKPVIVPGVREALCLPQGGLWPRVSPVPRYVLEPVPDEEGEV